MGVGAGVRAQRAAPSPGLRPTSPKRGEVANSAAARGAGERKRGIPALTRRM